MLTFKEYLKEYLTDRQLAIWSKHKMTAKARKDTDHYFGKDNDEVREEIKDYDIPKSDTRKAVEEHLGKKFTDKEYSDGITKDKYGRDVRIGKLIKDKNLVDRYASDNSKRDITGYYATSVRGTQVAGQTNPEPDEQNPKGHPWSSCKDINSGENRVFLKHEIKHGTVVVRVHDHTGKEVYRATLQPHHNDEGHAAYAVDAEYGLQHPSFTAHAHDVAKRLSGKHKGGSLLYTKHPNVYDNNQTMNIIHPNATEDDISTALDSEDRSVRYEMARHPKATNDHIDKAQKDKDYMVRVSAVQNPNATKRHIDNALNDENEFVRKAAIEHPNATSEHIDKALNDKHTEVRMAAASHYNATEDHINKALKDRNADVRMAALQNRFAVTKEHLKAALNDKNGKIRKFAADELRWYED